jgi:hypothetical protein
MCLCAQHVETHVHNEQFGTDALCIYFKTCYLKKCSLPEVKAAVKSWIREKSDEFFIDGLKKLVTRWEKCVSLNGDYVEK